MAMRMTIPIDNRMATPTLAGRATAWLRLFLIEMRRTPALYAGLLIALLTAWGMWNSLPEGVVRWREISHSAGQAMIPASAIAAGIGAYVVRRDERLHLDDQLAQTTFGQGRRDMLSLVATLSWCLLAYIVPVGLFFAWAATKATWAGPTWSYVAITAATIVLGVGGGWFTGTVFPNRFSVLVAVGGALAVHGFYPLSYRLRTVEEIGPDGGIYFDTKDAPYKNLFPYEVLDYYDIPSVIGWGAAWLVGVGTLLLCVAWWWRHRSIVAIIGFSVASFVAGPAATALVDQEPINWLEQSEQVAIVDPVCEARLGGQIQVCVHPQNEALLDDVAAVIEPLIAPVAGIPGVPTVFEEQQAVDAGPRSVAFYVHDERYLDRFVTESLIREMFNQPEGAVQYEPGSAQYVVLSWLLRAAGADQDSGSGALPSMQQVYRADQAFARGITDPDAFYGFMGEGDGETPDSFENEVAAAIDRFASLPDDERRAWLEANWDALRSNQLTLEDLP